MNKFIKREQKLKISLEIDEMMGFRQASTNEYLQKCNKPGPRIFGELCGCGSNKPYYHCCKLENYIGVK